VAYGHAPNGSGARETLEHTVNCVTELLALTLGSGNPTLFSLDSSVRGWASGSSRDGERTGVLFEHSGFDVSQPWGDQALRGAAFGWAKMLGQLPAVVAGLAADRN